MNNEIAIGCDNAAVEMKKTLIAALEHAGYQPLDLGVLEADDGTHYPLVAQRVARYVQEDASSRRGILLCGTGIGMAISANKFSGVRAAVGHDSFSVERSRLSNGCNILCMGARVIGVGLAKKLTLEWLSLGNVEPPSRPKVENILTIERKNFK